MFNLDEIIIDGVLYRRVEDKIEDRPINFNPFDISEKDEVFFFQMVLLPQVQLLGAIQKKDVKKNLLIRL